MSPRGPLRILLSGRLSRSHRIRTAAGMSASCLTGGHATGDRASVSTTMPTAIGRFPSGPGEAVRTAAACAADRRVEYRSMPLTPRPGYVLFAPGRGSVHLPGGESRLPCLKCQRAPRGRSGCQLPGSMLHGDSDRSDAPAIRRHHRCQQGCRMRRRLPCGTSLAELFSLADVLDGHDENTQWYSSIRGPDHGQPF